MALIKERLHNKYGFIKNKIAVKSASKSESNKIEILTTDLCRKMLNHVNL